MDEFRKTLDLMHRDFQAILKKSRKDAIERHNARSGVYPCNPIIGDYLVVARTKSLKTKMSANWVGLRRVAQVLSDFVFKVEYLLTGKVEDIHL